MQLYDGIDRFLEYLHIERNASPLTIEAYARNLGGFADHIEREFDAGMIADASLIGAPVIRNYMAQCFDRGLAPASMQQHLAALKSFFKFLARRGYIADDPSYGVSYPRRGRKLPRFLSDPQIDQILTFPLECFIDYRDRALLEVFYSSGARVSELAAASCADMYADGSTLMVMGKGSKQRQVYLVPSAIQAMREYGDRRVRLFGTPDPAAPRESLR